MGNVVTLIGGSGFIGRNVLRALAPDHQLCNIDKSPHDDQTIRCDIREREALEQGMPPADWVVLLAAEHKDNVHPVSLYYDVNVQGTAHVLEVMRKKNIRKILFTSTVAVYGLNKPNPDEDAPVDPFNHYGKSKYQAEELLRAWHREDPDNRTLVILRPTVVFGPENRGNVYNLLQQILNGNFKMVGSGKNIKSMSYVGNVVAFIRFCLTSNLSGYHLFNYADKPDLNTKELISIIAKSSVKSISPVHIPFAFGLMAGYGFDLLSKISGRTFSISSVRIRKFCATTQFSTQKIQTQTNFRAPFTLEEGLDTTIKSLL